MRHCANQLDRPLGLFPSTVMVMVNPSHALALLCYVLDCVSVWHCPRFALLQEVGSIHLLASFKQKLVDRQYVSTDQSGAHLLILYFCLCDCHCQILWRGRGSFVSPRDQITILGNHSLADSQSFDDRGGRCLKNRFF